MNLNQLGMIKNEIENNGNKFLTLKKDKYRYSATGYCVVGEYDSSLYMLSRFFAWDAYSASTFIYWLNDEADYYIRGDMTEIFKENEHLIMRDIFHRFNDEHNAEKKPMTLIKSTEFSKILKQWVNFCGDNMHTIKYTKKPDEIILKQTLDEFELTPIWYDG